MLGIAQSKEKTAAAGFVTADRALKADEAKLDTLKGYQQEYGQGEKPMSAGMLRSKRAFLSELSNVIAAQEQEVADRTVTARQEHDVWRSELTRRKSLERLVDRKAIIEIAALDKIEQAELDELGRRGALRATSSTLPSSRR